MKPFKYLTINTLVATPYLALSLLGITLTIISREWLALIPDVLCLTLGWGILSKRKIAEDLSFFGSLFMALECMKSITYPVISFHYNRFFIWFTVVFFVANAMMLFGRRRKNKSFTTT